MLKTTEEYKWVRAVKSKPKALWHFKVNPVLKIDKTVYKQAESMWVETDRKEEMERKDGDGKR